MYSYTIHYSMYSCVNVKALLAASLSSLHTRLRLAKELSVYKEASASASVDPAELEALVQAQVHEQLRLVRSSRITSHLQLGSSHFT